jgi:hypothetical protein
MPTESLRAIWEVTVGVIPGEPIPEHTKRFPLTSREWEQGTEAGFDALQAAQGAAMVYAMGMQNPNLSNWVRVDWIWY